MLPLSHSANAESRRRQAPIPPYCAAPSISANMSLAAQMSSSAPVVKGYDPDDASVDYKAARKTATWTVKAGLAQMLKGAGRCRMSRV